MTESGYKLNVYSLTWLAAGLLTVDDANKRSKTSWRQGSWSQKLWSHSILAFELIFIIRTALKIATRTMRTRPEPFLEAEDLERSIVPVYLVTSPTTLYGESLHTLIRRVRCAVLAYVLPRVVSAFNGVYGQETPRIDFKLLRFLMILSAAISSFLLSLLAYLVFPSWTNLQIQFYVAARKISSDQDHSFGGLSALFCHHALEIGDLYYELDRTGWITDTIRLREPKFKPGDSSRTTLSRVYCGETFFTEHEITARALELIEVSPGYEPIQYNCQSMVVNLLNRIKDDRWNGSRRTRTGYRNQYWNLLVVIVLWSRLAVSEETITVFGKVFLHFIDVVLLLPWSIRYTIFWMFTHHGYIYSTRIALTQTIIALVIMLAVIDRLEWNLQMVSPFWAVFSCQCLLILPNFLWYVFVTSKTHFDDVRIVEQWWTESGWKVKIKKGVGVEMSMFERIIFGDPKH